MRLNTYISHPSKKADMLLQFPETRILTLFIRNAQTPMLIVNH